MDTVLGVSMAPAVVRMVLVEGENADGVTVDEDNFELSPDGGSATFTAPDQVISAILGTREGAAGAGYRLRSTGVTWSSDQLEVAALCDALAARKMENVMLVSAFLAAAALAQTVGSETGYAQTALLFVETDAATLAVVHSADGSIADAHRVLLPEDDDEAVATLVEMVSGAEALEAEPDGVFVVGSGVDIPMIKPALEAATGLPLSAPEEPNMALARGAALASANAPLFASSTAGLAYAQDHVTGVVSPYAIGPGYLAAPDAPLDVDPVAQPRAYSAVPDSEARAYTVERAGAYAQADEHFTTGMFSDFGVQPVEQPSRQPFLTAMGVLAIFVVGVVALVLALAVSIRPHVSQRPSLARPHVVAPAKPAPAPAQVPAASAPAPAPPPAAAPAPPPAPPPIVVPPAPPPIRLPAPAPPPALPPSGPVPPIVPPLLRPPGIPGPGLPGPHGPGGFGGPHVPLRLPGLHLGF